MRFLPAGRVVARSATYRDQLLSKGSLRHGGLDMLLGKHSELLDHPYLDFSIHNELRQIFERLSL
jgi:hypothetical protein